MFSVLLNETKGFKYQIRLEVLLKKCELNGEIEFASVYFNSTTTTTTTTKKNKQKKIVVHLRFRLENYFEEILHLINVWINEGSGWIVESNASQYINISTY